MDDELNRLATGAIRGAAEELGVDPTRLARYLSGGRLADVLTHLRMVKVADRESVEVAESYLEFLDREIQLRERRGTRRD